MKIIGRNDKLNSKQKESFTIDSTGKQTPVINDCYRKIYIDNSENPILYDKSDASKIDLGYIPIFEMEFLVIHEELPKIYNNRKNKVSISNNPVILDLDTKAIYALNKASLLELFRLLSLKEIEIRENNSFTGKFTISWQGGFSIKPLSNRNNLI